MSPEIAVSVVVPVLNGADTIGDLLTGLAHQDGAPRDLEIIVVDNGSSDATCEVVRRFPVTLSSQPKPGPSAARNRGLAQARGEVVRSLLFCRFVDPQGRLLRVHFLVEPRRVDADRLRGHAWVKVADEYCEKPRDELLSRAMSIYTYPPEDVA